MTKFLLVGPNTMEALRSIGENAHLPPGYLYGPDAMESVKLGMKLATDAMIKAIENVALDRAEL